METRVSSSVRQYTALHIACVLVQRLQHWQDSSAFTGQTACTNSVKKYKTIAKYVYINLFWLLGEKWNIKYV